MLKSLRFIAALFVAFGALPLAAPSAGAADAPKPVLRIITFTEGTSSNKQQSIVKSLGAKVIHELKLINAIAVELPADRAGFADNGLRAMAEVQRVSEDHERYWLKGAAPASIHEIELPAPASVIAPMKADRLLGSSDKAESIPWGVAKVNAPQAWSKTMGAGVKVAVVDTGIDFNHPQLKDNIRGGYNAKAPAADPAQTANFMDDNGHGTHVSGTIAALKNGQDIMGVAPQASLYGIKVLDATGNGTSSDVIAGLDWAVSHGIDVANLSLGGGEEDNTPEMRAAVTAAAKAGLTIIAAAGNEGPGDNTVAYPARYPEAIAVAAITSAERTAFFSSRGPQVAITAPGQGIYSTYPTSRGGHATESGTSMACPHAAGVAALAIAAKGIHGVDAVRAALQSTARKLPGIGDNEQGAGLIDASRVVK